MLIQAMVKLNPIQPLDPNSEWIVAPESKLPGDSVQMSLEHEEGTPLPNLGALVANYQPKLVNPSAELQQNCANILEWLGVRSGLVETRQALAGEGPSRSARTDSVGVVANCNRGSDLMAQLMHCASHTQSEYSGNLPVKVQNLLGLTLNCMQAAGIPSPDADRDRIRPLADVVCSPGRPWR